MIRRPPVPPLAIDVTRLVRGSLLGRRPTGIDRVTLAYVRHFAPEARALLGRGRWIAELGGGLSSRVFARLCTGEVRSGPSAGWPAAPRFMLHTAHSGLESMAYLEAIRRRGLLPVILLHDLIPLTHPSSSRPGIPERHLLRVRNAMQVGAGVICNSEATRVELADLCATRGWPQPPTVVAHLGVESWVRPGPGPERLSPDGRPYFVCVGTIEPRKNHMLLLRVWQALTARLGERTPELLLIGQRGWMFDEVVQTLGRDEVARRHVREVGGCSDDELRDLLLGSRALLMPSVAEGFGLPVAEALGCGVPVIASGLPVYREFAGDVPDYLEAHDVSRWAAQVEAYCEPGSTARLAQLARLEGWQPPSWSSHFTAVEALLRQLGGKAGAT